MLTKPAPRSRCHWNAYVFPAPAQLPALLVSTPERATVPAGLGTELLTGGDLATESVGSEYAIWLPSTLVAVTLTRTVAPSSAPWRVYVAAVAPVMFTALRCHWYAYVLPAPAHVPGAAVRTEPRAAVPATVGATELAGGALATGPATLE